MQYNSCRRIAITVNQLRPSYDANKHIQNSKLSTFHFQNALPKLPVPTLAETDEKIRKAVKALEGNPSFQTQHVEEFNDLWSDFVATKGKELDKLLKDEDNKHHETNFVNAPWTDKYLRDRSPILINYNPTVVLTDAGQLGDRRPDQVRRAAQIIWATAKFHMTLRDEYLEPEVFHLKQKPSKNRKLLAKYLPNKRITIKSKGIDHQAMRYLPYAMNMSFPLDMSQYGNLLFSTRIPEIGKDRVQKAPDGTAHTAVLYNGRFYKLDVITANDEVRSQEDILADVMAIHADGEARGMNPDSVCPLSTTDRDTWARNRAKLVELGNSDSLDMVDHAMFMMTLDNYAYTSPGDCCKQTYCGEAENRWPDKSFQVVMGKCVCPGVVFEHAWGDGAAVLSYMNHVNHYVERSLADGTCRITNDLTPQNAGVVNEIKFVLDEAIATEINTAAQVHNKKFSELACTVAVRGVAPAVQNPWYYDQDAQSTKDIFAAKLNRNWMLERKIGADGFLQLSILLTGHVVKGHPVSAYESASTSTFRHGRTETIRPCTEEGQEACRIYLNEDLSNLETKKKFAAAIRKAIKRHNQQTKDCLGGHGWDRHIFGLRNQAAKHDIPEHPVFNCSAFTGLSEFVLSTSTLNSDAVSLGAFGPVVEGGFGVGYIVYPDWMGVSISGFKKDGADVVEFRETLYTIWEAMMDAVDAEKL